ncbi:hypothetical protein ACFYRL_35960 [Streptomyces goshikiensis]|uniref:hypothetical protein n=1 Tax=Streptomyces goshikiensis TaxID=1942 RepID=UPI0036D16F85
MASLVRAVSWERLGRPRKTGGLLLLLLGLDLGDLVLGGGEAGGQAFDFAEPSFAFGFGDLVFEVVAALFQAGLLVQGDDQDRAADAGFSELAGWGPWTTSGASIESG